jgi:hypothetical protein
MEEERRVEEGRLRLGVVVTHVCHLKRGFQLTKV